MPTVEEEELWMMMHDIEKKKNPTLTPEFLPLLFAKVCSYTKAKSSCRLLYSCPKAPSAARTLTFSPS